MSFLIVFLLITCIFLFSTTCEATLAKFFNAKKQVMLALKANNPGLALQHARYLPQCTLRKVLKKQNRNVEAHAEASYQLARKFTDKDRAVWYALQTCPYLHDKAEAIEWLSKQPINVLKRAFWRIVDHEKEPKRIRMLAEPLAKAIPSPQITIMVTFFLAEKEEAKAMLLVELATGVLITKVSDMLYAAAEAQNVSLFKAVSPYCKVMDYIELTPQLKAIEAMGMVYSVLKGENAREYIKLQWRELVRSGYYKSMLDTLEHSMRDEFLQKHLSVAPDEDSMAFVEALCEMGAKRTHETPIHEGWARMFAEQHVSEGADICRNVAKVVMGQRERESTDRLE
jgi:hypothetical protein